MKKLELTKDDTDCLIVALEAPSTKGVDSKELRKITKLENIINNMKDGILEIDADDFDYLVKSFKSCKSWNKVPTARKIIAIVEDKLDEALKEG